MSDTKQILVGKMRWVPVVAATLAICITPLVMLNAYLFVHSSPLALFVSAPGLFVVGMFGIRNEVVLVVSAIPIDFGYYYTILQAVAWLIAKRAAKPKGQSDLQ